MVIRRIGVGSAVKLFAAAFAFAKKRLPRVGWTLVIAAIHFEKLFDEWLRVELVIEMKHERFLVSLDAGADRRFD